MHRYTRWFSLIALVAGLATGCTSINPMTIAADVDGDGDFEGDVDLLITGSIEGVSNLLFDRSGLIVEKADLFVPFEDAYGSGWVRIESEYIGHDQHGKPLHSGNVVVKSDRFRDLPGGLGYAAGFHEIIEPAERNDGEEDTCARGRAILECGPQCDFVLEWFACD